MIMKKNIVCIIICVCMQHIHAQNVGVGTNTPAAKFTINGDFALISAPLTVADGVNYAIDVNTTKFSNYKLTGATGNFVIAGISAGSDGRTITLYNRTGSSMEIYDEDPSAVAANRIKTSTNATLAIYTNGNVTLQYDISINRWQVQNTHYSSLDYYGGSSSTNYWTAGGNDIYNNNLGNVGIGTTAPLQKLHVEGASLLANSTIINPKNYPNMVVAGRIADGTGWDALSAIGGSANTNFLSATGRPWAIGHNGSDLFIASGLSGTNALQTAIQIKGTGGNVILNPVSGNVGIRNSTPVAPLSFANVFGDRISFWTNSATSQYGIGIQSGTLQFYTAGADRMAFGYGSSAAMTETMVFYPFTGQLGIGTYNQGAYKLAVNGSIHSAEVVVETGWADFVFDKKYKLPPLSDVEKFITTNNHLPGIPSAQEIQTNGLKVGEVQTKMMQKIEELTLYIIEQDKKIKKLQYLISVKNNN
jgi:hypothetical protein